VSINRNVEQWRVYKEAVESDGGAVAAQHWLAAKAGAGALAAGGNAVDAAVACAFALNAVEPWMCGIGGSGFMVIWKADEQKAHVVNFQGVLAQNIDPADYPLDPSVPDALMGFPGVKDNRNVVGYGSITVPGAVAGLSTALSRFGKLGLDTVMSPAIQLAERGLPVDWNATLQIALEAGELIRNETARDIYMPGGVPAKPEQFLPLGNLATTLKAIADGGPDEFYRGRTAEMIAEDLQKGGSAINYDDLAAYEAVIHEPTEGSHRGATLYTAGDTSGGLRLIETLEYVAEHLDTSRPFGAHAYATYAHGLNKAFLTHKLKVGQIQKAGCTSHMSAVDAEGNIVALTYTLLNRFGSKVVLPQTGMLMNNSVSYFDPRPGFPTTMKGGLRINSSNMCPTVAVRDGEALFAVGASGANHITPCTTQIAAFLLDYGMSLEQAFNVPRVDASDRGSIRVDPAMGEDTLAELAKEFTLEVEQMLVFPKLYSCPSGVMRDAAAGKTWAISDKSSPIAGAAAEAPFELEDIEGGVQVRA
jgi:gamma-glutamyltranspeptidase/glutathione hydrolase